MTPSPEKPREGSERKLERSFIIERQGKPFVLMAGLLDLAHQDGLDLIETHLVQAAGDMNALTNVFRAIVHTRTGTFTGHGSAGPTNVSRMMLTHTLELAETRAIGRALRFATNIGMTTIEELGDDPIPGETEPHPTPTARPVQAPPPTRVDTSGADALRTRFPNGDPKQASSPTPTPAAAPPANGNAVTDAQLRAIYAIARTQHNFYEHETEDMALSVFGVKPVDMSRTQASEFIKNLQGKKE